MATLTNHHVRFEEFEGLRECGLLLSILLEQCESHLAEFVEFKVRNLLADAGQMKLMT
jgi:hypothetical protein